MKKIKVPSLQSCVNKLVIVEISGKLINVEETYIQIKNSRWPFFSKDKVCLVRLGCGNRFKIYKCLTDLKNDLEINAKLPIYKRKPFCLDRLVVPKDFAKKLHLKILTSYDGTNLKRTKNRGRRNRRGNLKMQYRNDT